MEVVEGLREDADDGEVTVFAVVLVETLLILGLIAAADDDEGWIVAGLDLGPAEVVDGTVTLELLALTLMVVFDDVMEDFGIAVEAFDGGQGDGRRNWFRRSRRPIRPLPDTTNCETVSRTLEGKACQLPMKS